MDSAPKNESRHELVFYNDPKTPYLFVVNLIHQIFSYQRFEAEEIVQRINKAGKWSIGPFPELIANAIYDEIQNRIKEANVPFLVKNVDFSLQDHTKISECSFCSKANTAVEKLFAGNHAYICDECVVLSTGKLHELLSDVKLNFTYKLLDWHFGDISMDNFVKTNRNYPGRVRADLQTAVEELFTSKAIRAVGIHQQYGHEQINLMTLWTSGRNAHSIAPLSFEELDIGNAEPKRCQINGLWLLTEGEFRYAVVLSREQDYQGGYKLFLEVSGPQGADTEEITRKIFDSIEKRIREARSYRGKVLSLEQSPHYGGSSTGITVHKMEAVEQEQVILPEKTIDDLNRTVVRFCKQRDQLRKLGLQTKRGVMFYGPPGTGKTHTIKYLASQLSNHTTFLVTAEQIGLLPEYFSLARLMQPVIFVIEDADLLAKSREMMHSPNEEILLNHLLNEMDGLKDDADILFVLSTNKPEVLEEALVARPGRIDQLIEFPKPDEECRSRLMSLYGGNLKVSDEIKKDISARTEGVSASFIKELMRRLAQYSLERDSNGVIESSDVEQALEEMLFSNNVLNRTILGGTSKED